MNRPTLAIFWFTACMTPGIAIADAIVVTRAMKASTIAEVFVKDQEVRAHLEVGVGDLQAFRNVLPDELYERLTGKKQPLEERFRTFIEQDWVLLAGDERLEGRLERIAPGKRLVRDEITGEPVAVQPEDPEMVVEIEIIYQLENAPQSITIRPPSGADNQFAAANVGFVAYHQGVAVNDFRYLSRAETLDLDWDDPWHSRFRNRNLLRQFDSPMSVFLYVEHFEVRKEIIIRPKDLQNWVDLGLGSAATIPIEEQPEVKRIAAEFLAAQSPLTIDGREVQGELDRIHFISRTLRKTGVIDPPEELATASATLGVIFVYPIPRLPQKVSLTWELFTPKLQSIPAATTDEAGGLPTTLTPDDPVLRWQNFLTNPQVPAMLAIPAPPVPSRITIPSISMLCVALFLGVVVTWLRQSHDRSRRITCVAAGIGSLLGGLVALPFANVSLADPFARQARISSDEEDAILGSLLHNTYRAFDRREENLVYDRLATSISGDLLTEVYLQTRRSMELEGQGGARVKVQSVELLETKSKAAIDSGGFVRRARWNVSGSVGHWGHTHRRTNQYEAEFRVVPVDATWKVTKMDLLDQQRLDKSL